ncbi:hypothetical protein RF11_03808 [Thelohanellus kitauei]|uniref:Uncharacterized protein n=1 Tax=Thelohanellus kitauei TaxID=669202 RepID=A0A0C2MXJ0_THEKT|nr:hypothetical protein RF11_03808 [Thelohanellus kitauei]
MDLVYKLMHGSTAQSQEPAHASQSSQLTISRPLRRELESSSSHGPRQADRSLATRASGSCHTRGMTNGNTEQPGRGQVHRPIPAVAATNSGVDNAPEDLVSTKSPAERGQQPPSSCRGRVRPTIWPSNTQSR